MAALAWLRDLVLGLAVVVALWLTVIPADATFRWIQILLASSAVAGLLVSRYRPLPGVILTGAATAAAWLLGVTTDPCVLTGFAVFLLAERRGIRRIPRWLPAWGLLLFAGLLVFSAAGIEERLRWIVLSSIVLAGAWALGVRTAQARREAAARSRAEERLRLARDVHDVLSHSLGTIGVQAGVAAHVSTLDEKDLRGVLRDIEDGARSSMSELKLLLQHERQDQTASLPPAAALADVIAAAERVGIAAELNVRGDLQAIPAAARTTTLRIVQEAVTNTIRHTKASAMTVELQLSPEGIRICVADNGRGSANAIAEGHGLRGIRERAELMGGTLSIDSESTGLGITAWLPITIPAEAEESR